MKRSIISSRIFRRFVHNRAKHDETTNQQIERLFAVLFPNRNLQEREINVTYFLTRYGYGLIERLLEEIDLDSPDHKLVKLTMILRKSEMNCGSGFPAARGTLVFTCTAIATL